MHSPDGSTDFDLNGNVTNAYCHLKKNFVQTLLKCSGTVLSENGIVHVLVSVLSGYFMIRQFLCLRSAAVKYVGLNSGVVQQYFLHKSPSNRSI